MRYFAGLLFIVIVFSVAILMAKHAQRERLPRSDRKELVDTRNFLDDLFIEAADHAQLGDDFAVIALDKINKFKRSIK